MAAQEKEPWDLVIGQVTAPFGVKGALRVRPETDLPERFRGLERICLELPSGEERIEAVREVRVTPRGIILQLAGCDDRGSAASLRGAWVKVRQSMAIPLPPGNYWIHEIIGLKVVTEDGDDLGEVTEVIRTPGNDVYVTALTMVPAVREVVRKIDLENGLLVVAPLAEEEPEQDEASG
jgi:16S rRNA processing protein RimM